MKQALENFRVFALAVSQDNGSLRQEALSALSAAGIHLKDNAGLIRTRIPTRADGMFSALCDAIAAGDRQGVKRASDQLRGCGLSVRIDPKLIDQRSISTSLTAR